MTYGTYCRLNVHALASEREVIRACRRKMRPAALRARADKAARRSFYSAMLAEHARARKLYLRVLHGG